MTETQHNIYGETKNESAKAQQKRDHADRL